MGQKTHPTGFRTGVNKSHNAIWFANYGAYSEVLKEDYKIRKFFEKKFESLYSKAEQKVEIGEKGFFLVKSKLSNRQDLIKKLDSLKNSYNYSNTSIKSHLLKLIK